jgi:hypothetical protein
VALEYHGGDVFRRPLPMGSLGLVCAMTAKSLDDADLRRKVSQNYAASNFVSSERMIS